MEFLDPKKQRQHTIRLFIGYILVAIALILTTIILLYQAYGFGVNKNGQVIQNGLVFVSSTPGSANIYINGKMKATTNARLFLPAGQYTFEVGRDGYRNWKRAITVEGGSVEHFDYPFLIPNDLSSSAVKKYPSLPGVALQSPDRRWLLVQSNENFSKFDMFDLNNKQPAQTLKEITVPGNLLSPNSGAQAWQLEEWANDNRHVLLKRIYQASGQPASEYILLDREEPNRSINLTKTLGTNPSKIELRSKKYDQYYLYDQGAAKLSTATIKEPEPKTYLEHVLAFKSHGDDVMLYATTDGAPFGKVMVKVRDDDKTYTIRQLPAGPGYLLDLTEYSGSWYVAAGVPAENRVYVYRDPMAELNEHPKEASAPINILKVGHPSYVAFSDNARFVMAEGGERFAVYDAENDKGYAYQTGKPLDAPQEHAVWMDGHRLTYISKGKVEIFDFDGINQQTLTADNPAMRPIFDQRYRFLYTFSGQASEADLGRTPLRLPADL